MNPITSLPAIANLSQFAPTSLQGTADATLPSADASSNPVAAADGFTQALTSAIGSISGLQTTADQAVSGFALNQGVDIHQAMIAMQQASLGMNLAVQVRDKAVEAYQSIMNMQM